MSGVVERLRAFDTKAMDAWAICAEAADEIERLREALTEIITICGNDGYPNEIVAERMIDRVDECARAALEPKP